MSKQLGFMINIMSASGQASSEQRNKTIDDLNVKTVIVPANTTDQEIAFNSENLSFLYIKPNASISFKIDATTNTSTALTDLYIGYINYSKIYVSNSSNDTIVLECYGG